MLEQRVQADWQEDQSQEAAVLQGLLNGYRATMLLHVAAKLRIPDTLAAGHETSEAMAKMVEAEPDALRRVLYGLEALGVVREQEADHFQLTALGEGLRSDLPGSLWGMALRCGEEYIPAWECLLHSVTTGAPAFDQAFGVDRFTYRAQHPELNEQFNKAQVRRSAQVVGDVIAAYDFSRFRTIADIGGGYGVFLAAILQASPATRGILFDQPHVVCHAAPFVEAAGVTERCRVVAGSFLDGVPGGADAYILKEIIHDFHDRTCLRVLEHCRRAMDGRAKLIVVDRIMPDRAPRPPHLVWTDLGMLVMGGGGERTEAQNEALLGAAGFRLTAVIPTKSIFSVIEAVPM